MNFIRQKQAPKQQGFTFQQLTRRNEKELKKRVKNSVVASGAVAKEKKERKCLPFINLSSLRKLDVEEED